MIIICLIFYWYNQNTKKRRVKESNVTKVTVTKTAFICLLYLSVIIGVQLYFFTCLHLGRDNWFCHQCTEGLTIRTELLENIYYYQLFECQAVTAKESIPLKNHSHISYTLYLRSSTPWKSIIYTKTWVQPANSGYESSSKDLVLCTLPMSLVVSH